MKKERFFELMNDTDDALIDRAEKYSPPYVNLRAHRIIRWTAVAATLCVIIAACIAVPISMRRNGKDLPDIIETNESNGSENGGTEHNDTESVETDDPMEDIYRSRPGVYREEDYPDQPGTEGLKYSLSSDKTSYYVVGYEGTVTDIVIPDTYEGLPVTTIASWTEMNGCVFTTVGAFSNNTKITSVIIGKNVEYISGEAFANCTNLKKVVIPDSVRSISSFGEGAFFGCTSLSEIIISDNVEEIGSRAFYNTAYYNDESNWTDGVLYIGNHLYKSQDIIGSYTVRAGTKTIADSAFYSCGKLTEIIFPYTLRVIGNNVFSGCHALKNISMSSNIQRIGQSAFYGTKYYNNESNWEDGVLYIGEYLIASNASVKGQLTVKEGTFLIADSALAQNYKLLSVTLPKSLEYIGQNAFHNCYNLLEVYNLSSLNIVKGEMSDNGYVAYYASDVYTSLSAPTKFIQQGDYLFYGDDQYFLMEYTGDSTQLTLPSSINGNEYEIRSYIFYGNSSITKVTIPEGVTVIGKYAFYGCENLTDVIVNAACDIEIFVFWSCDKLIHITLSDKVRLISDRIFDITVLRKDGSNVVTDSQGVKALYLGNHLIDVQGNVWEDEDYKSPESFTVREGTKTIAERALSGFDVNNIKLPESVEYIGDYAFDSSDMIQVNIPDKVKIIEEYTFYDSLLKSIIIGNGIEKIDRKAFEGLVSFTAVYYNGTEAQWNQIDIDEEGNTALLEATVYFYSETEPTTEGNYWHYVGGVPTVW